MLADDRHGRHLAACCAAHSFKHCHRVLCISSQLIEFNESPIFMLLDTTISALRKDLPVTLFETGVGALGGQQQGWAKGQTGGTDR